MSDHAPHDTAPQEAEIIAQQIRAISRLTGPMMIANLVNISSYLLLRVQTDSLSAFDVLWAGSTGSLALYFLYGIFSRRHKPFPEKLSRGSRRKLIAFAGLLGVLWSLPGIFVLPMAVFEVQVFLIILCAGMVAGSAIALYPVPKAAYLCCGLMAGSHLLGFALTGTEHIAPFVIVALMFMFVIAQSVMRHESIFVSEFRLRRALDEKTATIAALLDETVSKANLQKIEAEKQLLEMQKMEAVGRLTAGIAHDFNNLLAVIMGNVELVLMDTKDAGKKKLLGEAARATERGAELTNRLLAFGRKSSLRPERADLNEKIRQILPLIRRALTSSVVVRLDLSDRPCWAEIDVAQFESALLNLAINARDAMDGKGTIVFGTRATIGCETSAADGSMDAGHVEVFVCDTGPGFPEDILHKAFEPFFTTKPIGKGSGLGLAMVYGFAKQSGGYAEIAPSTGTGAKVSLFFPAVEAVTAEEHAVSAIPQADQALFEAKAIVVDDDAAVLRVVAFQMSRLGFDVLEASDGEAALHLLAQNPDVALLLTDFSMPGVYNGAALIARATEIRPDLKVVMMSGYPNHADEMLRSRLPDVPCLAKPLNYHDLEKHLTTIMSG